MSVAAAELRVFDLFDGLDDATLARWAASVDMRAYEPGELVTDPAGTVRPSFRLLFEGKLDGYRLIDGREEHDYTQVAPTWLGAIVTLGVVKSGIAMRAAEPSKVGAIAAEPFRQLLFDTPIVFERVMGVFGPVIARFESDAQQREKLAALGRMSAGLAHELNNPAAAAKRSAALLADALEVLDGAPAAFVESGVERADAEAFVKLKREALDRARASTPRSGLDAADAEDAIGTWLEEHDVADAWQLAEPLASAGLDAAWLDRVADLAGKATPTAVRWVATALTARALADELRDSTDRISSLVKAIKAYTYMDQSGLQEIDVHDGLEATLTILNHKLKHTAIEVRRDYAADLPRVCVYGSELNQVWTNLLDNAIDALGNAGAITITTARWNGDGVEVTIADDGPGIAPDVQDRVFEPFFTTKPVGAGTGLGLDTVLRIIRDRHDGTVRLRSEPGATVFTVRLPRSPRKG